MNTKKNVKAGTTAKKSTGAKTETTKKPVASKSTATTTKTAGAKTKGMLTTLKSLLDSGKITDKKLKAEVQNSLKVKNPTAEAVSELLKRVIDSGKTAVVENETKKVIKKSTTKTTEKAETKKTTSKVAPKATPQEEKKSPVQSVKTVGNYNPPIATIFPEEVLSHISGAAYKLTKAQDNEFLTMNDFVKAMEDDKIIIIACYWTPRHIKEYNYGIAYAVENVPKSFENDLDLAQGVTTSEMNHKFYAMSIVTEAMYAIFEEDLKPIEDTNPYTGEKYKIRVSNGMEFAVYVAEEVKEEPKAKKPAKAKK